MHDFKLVDDVFTKAKTIAMFFLLLATDPHKQHVKGKQKVTWKLLNAKTDFSFSILY